MGTTKLALTMTAREMATKGHRTLTSRPTAATAAAIFAIL